MPAGQSIADYIQSRVQVDEAGCWIWQLATSTSGYGVVRLWRWRGYAHRYTYTHLVGPIPEGLQLDHLCRVRRCVNPAHLEPVTNHVNVLRRPDLDHAKRLAVFPQRDGLWCARVLLKNSKQKRFRSRVRSVAEQRARAWMAENPDAMTRSLYKPL